MTRRLIEWWLSLGSTCGYVLSGVRLEAIGGVEQSSCVCVSVACFLVVSVG